MHGDIPTTPLPPAAAVEQDRPWYSLLSRYHWYVLTVAALGWLFDCLDQQLFIMARQPAMKELLPEDWNTDQFSAYATAIFLMGWASGGLFFGVLGDRIGRARTMLITILVYSLCTGLSAASVSFWDFALYRFVTGLGVGGEFAVGVALVAEVMPHRARPYTLALLQALSAIGNVSAAVIYMVMGGLREAGLVTSIWRPMFVIGAVPALLALLIRRRLKEPEVWQQAAHEGAVARQLGSYRALFQHPVWRRHALIGLALAFAGVVGLWAVGFYTIDLVGNVVEARFAGKESAGSQVAFWKSMASIMLNLGGAMGTFGFGLVTQRIGRKPTFLIAFLAAAASTAAVLLWLEDFGQIFWMLPIMGVCQFSLFAGYAIYFPELFPTHLRSTGTSFCYNVGRFVAAVGPALLGLLIKLFEGTPVEKLRSAGLVMCSVFLIGLVVLPFAPETRNRPLPE